MTLFITVRKVARCRDFYSRVLATGREILASKPLSANLTVQKFLGRVKDQPTIFSRKVITLVR